MVRILIRTQGRSQYLHVHGIEILNLFLFACCAGDLNETFFVGNVDEASRRLVQCTYECLDKAIAAGNYLSCLCLVALLLLC